MIERKSKILNFIHVWAKENGADYVTLESGIELIGTIYNEGLLSSSSTNEAG